MDPAVISGAETLKLGVKLGHHAYDHDHGHDHRLNPNTDAPVSPIGYGLSSMAKPALWGALSIAAFALIYAVVTGSVNGTSITAILDDSKTWWSSVAGGITGAIWGSGMGFYKGYTHATQHNALVQQGVDDIEISRGTSRSKTIETALENAPRKGMVILDNGMAIPVGMVAQQDDAPAMVADEPARARPQWMNEILERGPRAATAEQTVAISSQNGR